jgi:glutaredoxin
MGGLFILYGIPNCSFCLKSKQLLDEMKLLYQYHEINVEKKSEFLDDMAPKTNNQRTFPLVFHQDEFVGGYTELEDYLAFCSSGYDN